MMSPALSKAVQDVLDQSTIHNNKSLIRSLELVTQLINHDAYVAKHVVEHLVTLLKK
jgi:hypothetical protein